MSIESLEYLDVDTGRDDEDRPPREVLSRVLARQVLASGTPFWRPDFLTEQMANDIAWEIGARARVVPTRLRLLESNNGDSFAIRIDHYDNVVPIRK